MRHTKLLFVGVLLLVMIISGTAGASTYALQPQSTDLNQMASSGYVPGQLIVKFKPYAANLLRVQLEDQTGEISDFKVLLSLDRLNQRYAVVSIAPVFSSINPAVAQDHNLSRIYVLTVSKSTDIWQMAADYQANPYVVYAEPNYVARLFSVKAPTSVPSDSSDLGGIFPNDVAFGEQYALHNTGQNGGTPDADVDAPEAWQIQTGDPSVMIAILDTGVDYNHEDLAAQVRTDLDLDFVSRDGDAMDSADHGTRVAGVAAASTNNSSGIAGMCWGCQVVPVRVAPSVLPHFASLSVAQGIVYASIIGADVINMSLGGQCSNLWADAVNFAYDRDVVLVAAAGNFVEFVSYPALFNRVMAISATDRNDQLASFSSFGPAVDIAAPGADIKVTTLGGGLSTGSGTSYSSALTSGIVGLLRSENPELTNAQVRQILRNTAEDLGFPGFDQSFGHGRVNAHRALLWASVPPVFVYNPGPDSCGCVLDQVATSKVSLSESKRGLSENQFSMLYRLRDEVLATTSLGQRITDQYYRHSIQVTSLLLRDSSLRDEGLDLLNTGLPYLVSLLDEEGQKRLDGQLIDDSDQFVQKLANRANPELRSDLLQTWELLNLKSYVGQPVRDIVRALGKRAEVKIYLPIITK